MKRRIFDILVGVAGLFLALALIMAGGLLTWAHDFIGNEVHTQLAAQQIYFPPANSAAVAGIAAIAAFIAAAVMLILGGLGLMHARRTSPAAELLPGPHESTPVSA